jgi:hypothetical protein
MGHTVANISMATGSVADLAHTFPFGIEEEYFLVDAKTKAIALMVPEALFAIAKASSEGRIKGEPTSANRSHYQAACRNDRSAR